MNRLIGRSELARRDVSGATDGFADALNRVTYKGERVILQRRGKDAAVLVPVEDLTLPEVQEDRLRGGRLRTVVADVRSARPPRRLYGHPEVDRRNGDSVSRR